MSVLYDHLIKLLVIGDSGVGKSCMLLRFVEDNFTPSFITTIGIDFRVRTIDLDGKKIKLQIWDTAGQERFQTITTAYYRGAMGILVAYDITDQTSFNNMDRWMANIKEHADKDVDIGIVGNKSDLEDKRRISKEQGKQKTEELGLKMFMECSAKTGENVDAAYIELARMVKRRLIDSNPDYASDVAASQAGNVKLDSKAPEQKKGCC